MSVLAAVIVSVGQGQAQPVQQVGTSTSFDVATWNVEWFGATGSGQGPANEALQLENVASIIEGAGIDLWALQEISSVSAFSQLLTRLGAQWTGEIAPFTQTQRTAYIWRPDVVLKLSTRLILQEQSNVFAGRPPFEFRALVTLPDTTFEVTLVNVHMKAGADQSDYDQRIAAASALKARFDFFRAFSAITFMLIGDLNDELGSSIRTGLPSPYRALVEDPANYRFLTAQLDAADACTWCPSGIPQTGTESGSTLDHILISREAFPLADRGMSDRMRSVLAADPFFPVYTSDHVPVYARLQGPLPTSIEPLPRDAGLSIYPVPARDHLRIERSGAASHSGSVELFDLLGRRVRAVTEASLILDWNLEGLAPGLYSLVIGGRPVRLVPVL